jgi:hypothetical protein
LNGVLQDASMRMFKAADYEEATQIATDDLTVKFASSSVETPMFWGTVSFVFGRYPMGANGAQDLGMIDPTFR